MRRFGEITEIDIKKQQIDALILSSAAPRYGEHYVALLSPARSARSP